MIWLGILVFIKQHTGPFDAGVMLGNVCVRLSVFMRAYVRGTWLYGGTWEEKLLMDYSPSPLRADPITAL